MHGTDFLIDLDVRQLDDVATPASLDLGIINGVQLLPLLEPGFSTPANRFLVFTGTAICNAGGFPDSDEIARGVVRIRLGYRLAATRVFHGSAAFAALAHIKGEDGQDASLFAVDMANVVTNPADGPLPANNLPSNELYLILDVAVGESGSRLRRIGYQANVLMEQSDPDIQSLLVSHDGIVYSSDVTVQLASPWWFEVIMTGPVPQGETFTIGLQSSDKITVPTAPHSFIDGDGTTVTYDFFGGTVGSFLPPFPRIITITALGKHVMKTAILRISELV